MNCRPQPPRQLPLLVALLATPTLGSGARAEAIRSGFLADLRNPPKNYVANGSFNRGLERWHFFKKRGGAVVPKALNGESCFKTSGSFDGYVYVYHYRRGNGFTKCLLSKPGHKS